MKIFVEYIRLKIMMFYMFACMDWEKPKEERGLFLRMINKGQQKRLMYEALKKYYTAQVLREEYGI